MMGTGEQSASKPENLVQNIDLELLTEVKGIERFLRSEDLELDPDPKAKLIVILYDRFYSAKERPKTKVIRDYLRLAS